MFSFHSINLSNYGIWDEVEFNFTPGLTLVNGGNRSGKSLLFSGLGPLFYDSDEIITNGRATLNFSNQFHEFDWTVYNQGKGKNRYEVVMDGKHQKTERITDARNVIEKHFVNNIQQSIFETTVSLTGLGKHPLTTGKPATRLDWVNETLAYASILDGYIGDVDRKLKDTRDKHIKHGILRDQLTALNKPEKPEVAVDELRVEMDDITERVKKLEHKRDEIRYALKNKDKKIDAPKFSYKEAKERYEAAEAVINDMAERKRSYDANTQRRKLLKKLNSLLDEKKQAYKKACGKKLEVVSPTKMIPIVNKLIKDYKEELRQAESANETYHEQASLRKFIKKYKDYECSSENIDHLRRTITTLSEQQNILKLRVSAHNSNEKFCSVCGSDLKGHKKDVKAIQRTIDEYEKKIKQWELEIKIVEARLFKLKKKVDTDEIETALEDAKKVWTAADAYLEVKDRINQLGEDEDVEFDEEEFLKAGDRYTKAQKAFVDAKVYRSTQEQLSKIKENEYFEHPKKKLIRMLEGLEETLSDLYKKQRTVNDSIIKAETGLILYRKYLTEKKELVANVDELSRASKDHKILQVLKKALGRDGFRTKRLESTLELFVDNLNELAPLIWKESFKFEIDTGPRKCDLIVHRNGKRGTAKGLSGSEQRCWQLLAGLAMLRLLPDNRRCDTIILDELEANMDEASVHMMMHDFIPELQKTVPNVVIVSPLSMKKLNIKPDTAYFVEKRRNKSSLKHL